MLQRALGGGPVELMESDRSTDKFLGEVVQDRLARSGCLVYAIGVAICRFEIGAAECPRLFEQGGSRGRFGLASGRRDPS